MRKLLFGAMLGVVVSAGLASADGIPRYTPRATAQQHGFGPHASSVTWPSVIPPGWYTNTYNHAWYYPWYAYYNFSASPYANWTVNGGVAGYANHGPAGIYHSHQPPAQPYIGEWMGRVQGSGSFDALQGMAYPLAYPRELKDKK